MESMVSSRALSLYIRGDYWLDFTQLNKIDRYKREEDAHTAVKKFDVIPDSLLSFFI